MQRIHLSFSLLGIDFSGRLMYTVCKSRPYHFDIGEYE